MWFQAGKYLTHIKGVPRKRTGVQISKYRTPGRERGGYQALFFKICNARKGGMECVAKSVGVFAREEGPIGREEGNEGNGEECLKDLFGIGNGGRGVAGKKKGRRKGRIFRDAFVNFVGVGQGVGGYEKLKRTRYGGWGV